MDETTRQSDYQKICARNEQFACSSVVCVVSTELHGSLSTSMWGLEIIETSERVMGEARGCSVDKVGPLGGKCPGVQEVRQTNAGEVAPQQRGTEGERDERAGEPVM